MTTRTIYTRVETAVYDELARIAQQEDRAIGYIVARILKTSLPNAKPATGRKAK